MRWNGTDHPIDFGTNTFVASAQDRSHAGTAEVTVYDPTTGLESNPLPVWIPFATACTDMAWNPVNRRLYLSTATSVILLNPDTGDAEATIPVDIPIARLTVSPDGGYLFATSPASPTLRRYQILKAAPWLANPVDISIPGIIDFASVPDRPGSVAVYAYSGVSYELAIYDGSVKRPATVPYASRKHGNGTAGIAVFR